MRTPNSRPGSVPAFNSTIALVSVPHAINLEVDRVLAESTDFAGAAYLVARRTAEYAGAQRDSTAERLWKATAAALELRYSMFSAEVPPRSLVSLIGPQIIQMLSALILFGTR